ncbi:hypothetical protein PMN64_11270 [Bradyrhizobium sp. UFLA01-814]|uniref:hypothetical protein n=1 Tax=Bradyrhizobium sp. UFLA01-814 TaxID=3023480 RepID=UPI00398A67B1
MSSTFVVPPRKVEFAPEPCLQAILAWLEKSRGQVAQEAEVIDVEGVPWLSLKNVASKDDRDDTDAERLLCPLAKRPPSAHNPRLADEIMIVEIYDTDPTPRTYSQGPDVRVTETRRAWASLAIVRGKDRLEAKEYDEVILDWGVTAQWPFK